MRYDTCACGSRKVGTARRCRRCRDIDQRGAGNVRWKGGRLHSRGYVYVQQREHPRADSRGYIAEHTVVMEAQLGRLLQPGETVHHRNGVRDDNRPENLELWATTQPAGQRAADLLAWAHDIVALYEPARPIIIPADEVLSDE